MKERLRIVSLLLCVMMFIGILSPMALASEESSVGRSADDMIRPDALLNDYMHKLVSEPVLFADADIQKNLLEVHNMGDVGQSISAKIECSVYTLASGNDPDATYYTIVDFVFLEDMTVTENDQIDVEVNQCLFPNGSAQGSLYTKQGPDGDWTHERDFSPLPLGLQRISVWGGQMASRGGRPRIIISFQSTRNETVSMNSLRYVVTYYHVTNIQISIWYLFPVIALVAALAIFFFRRRAKRHRIAAASPISRSSVPT